jgi:hypothetical protein
MMGHLFCFIYNWGGLLNQYRDTIIVAVDRKEADLLFFQHVTEVVREHNENYSEDFDLIEPFPPREWDPHHVASIQLMEIVEKKMSPFAHPDVRVEERGPVVSGLVYSRNMAY